LKSSEVKTELLGVAGNSSLQQTMAAENMSRTALDKQEVAVIGTGPAGLVAAYALKNDVGMKYNVTLFEMVCSLTTF
jgi:NADPH-dependent glutamate synthase beta subunit-like oxidoreductase